VRRGLAWRSPVERAQETPHQFAKKMKGESSSSEEEEVVAAAEGGRGDGAGNAAREGSQGPVKAKPPAPAKPRGDAAVGEESGGGLESLLEKIKAELFKAAEAGDASRVKVPRGRPHFVSKGARGAQQKNS
jgi:hypothetical protein